MNLQKFSTLSELSGLKYLQQYDQKSHCLQFEINLKCNFVRNYALLSEKKSYVSLSDSVPYNHTNMFELIFHRSGVSVAYVLKLKVFAEEKEVS